MPWNRSVGAALLAVLCVTSPATAVQSVARQWNEAELQAIRIDLARPTVHARNLFHLGIAMYDAWAVYDATASTFFLGKTVGGFTCPFVGVPPPADVSAARDEAISYAAYRLLRHRFRNSPGATVTMARFDSLMTRLGHDRAYLSTDYTNGRPAALGNYLAERLIEFGLQDGSNEAANYANQHYQPRNAPLAPSRPGNPTITDLNHWQPLTLDFVDQSGNVFPRSTPPFLSPEWGRVTPFALKASDRTIRRRDGYDYWLYDDPGDPPYLDSLNAGGPSDEYKWNFELVSIWSSHLDASDGVMWDISPASIGNNPSLPRTLAEYHGFYDLEQGGDAGRGRNLNPRTGAPYVPQIVPRGDYARVLAEFWADGPQSETPPGHWFTILNYVSDHPLFQKRLAAQGPVLGDLEWDVKAYFTLGGAVHDAAVAVWAIKGWYDYIRPISAIRAMCDLGQCTDPSALRYHPAGMPIIPGFVETIPEGDSLAGPNGENVGKIKLWAWRAHDYIADPRTSVAGAGWIQAARWWPYQRPTFVTPPFAGYISGHSTFSRAAAEVMTLLTGDEYFPGGMGEFEAPRNQFLVFEDGPSVDVTLQWATYRDASDQCSLSRIWGGIHPPADDMPGRLIGARIGPAAFQLAQRYFQGEATPVAIPTAARVFPNPVSLAQGVASVRFERAAQSVEAEWFDVRGHRVRSQALSLGRDITFGDLSVRGFEPGIYFLRLTGPDWRSTSRVCLLR